VTQPAKVVEGWKGVLDHLRREVPAPMRTATVLFHAERASTRSRASASDMPVRRATSASASPRGAPLERRSATAFPPPREHRTEDEEGRPGALMGAAPQPNLLMKSRHLALAASVRSGPFHAAGSLTTAPDWSVIQPGGGSPRTRAKRAGHSAA
jgi:hypothetical protein